MTSSFTQLGKWWQAQTPVGSMLLWRRRCFHGGAPSPAPGDASLRRQQKSPITYPDPPAQTHPHKPSSWLRLPYKPEYKWLRTQFVPPHEGVGGRSEAEKSQTNRMMRMWRAWRIYGGCFFQVWPPQFYTWSCNRKRFSCTMMRKEEKQTCPEICAPAKTLSSKATPL